MDTDTTYVQLNDVNTTDSIRPASLAYNGTIDFNASSVNCLKFRIQTQTFPVHVPQITPIENIKMMDFNGMTNKSSTVYRQSGFFTNWAICVAHPINGENFEFSSQPVKWLPQKYLDKKPISFPTRLNVLTNPYFYCFNSIHVLAIIESTLNQILDDLGLPHGIRMVKTSGTYQLLIDSTQPLLDNVRVFFNYDLSQAFNFYYKTDFIFYYNSMNTYGFSEVVFEDYFTTKINATSYYTSQVLSLTTRLFPFSEIQFVSSGLSAKQIVLGGGDATSINNSKPIIFSYSLNVTDIDQPCDNFNYTAVSGFRKSNINSTFVKFSLDIYFQTYDGYSIRLSLDKNDSADMLLQFD